MRKLNQSLHVAERQNASDVVHFDMRKWRLHLWKPKDVSPSIMAQASDFIFIQAPDLKEWSVHAGGITSVSFDFQP